MKINNETSLFKASLIFILITPLSMLYLYDVSAATLTLFAGMVIVGVLSCSGGGYEQ